MHLSCIIDLYSRKIVAWTLGKTLETKHVVNAVNEAIARTKKKPMLIHTDRGVKYTSQEYAECTIGIQKSYSPKGSPWDNACIEIFHSLLKRERLWRFKIRNYEHARSLLFEYINAFYNTVRIHSHCGYLSPAAFEKQYYVRLKAAEKEVA